MYLVLKENQNPRENLLGLLPASPYESNGRTDIIEGARRRRHVFPVLVETRTLSHHEE